MLPVMTLAIAFIASDTASTSDRKLSEMLTHCIIAIRSRRYFVEHPRCYRRFPLREMTGIWVVGLETSLFIEHGHGSYSIEEATRIGAELNSETNRDPRMRRILASGKSAYYEIRIVGRRATIAGPSGAHSILLERLISIRRIA